MKLRILIRVALIGCAALVLGLILNRRPGGIGWSMLRESLPWGGLPIERIDADSAYAVLNSAVFLDFRPEGEFKIDRIPGAKRLDFTELAGGRFDPELPKSAFLVLYCFEPECPRIETACRMLLRSGRRAVILDGGFAGWLERGYPVEKGG